MAMLISKFHRLIQSKIVWWSILSIIVLTFVVWGTTTPNSKRQNDEAGSPGKLNGKSVSRDDFRSAFNNSYLSAILSIGRPFNITPEIDAQLRQAAWMRIASLEEATKLGITATDDEVAAQIQQNPSFLTQDGQFYKPGYKNFIEQLGSLGFDEKRFEEHVRQEIMLQKIRLALNRSTLVPPRDILRTFSSISDKFKIEYAILGPSLVTNFVQASAADAQAYFDKDPTAFTIPELMKVKYVRFAVAPFISKAEVTTNEVEEYYNTNIESFPADTNKVAAVDTNMVIASKYKPFADVQQEISNKLVHDKAMDLAAERAMEFVMDLTPDRDGKAMAFEDAAKKYETLVETPAPFSMREPLKDIDAGLAFNKAAFELGNDELTAVSEPVHGKEFVYVIGFDERIPSRVPTFKEVAGDVLPLAQAQVLSDGLSAKAQEIHDAAAKAIQEKKSFSSALEPFGVAVVTSDQFTASTGPTTNKYGDLLMRGVMTLNQGEVSELLPADDAVLIAYVAERLPGDPTTFDSLKTQIETTIRRQNGRYVYDTWQKYLLKQANLEEKKFEAPDDEPEEEPVDHKT